MENEISLIIYKSIEERIGSAAEAEKQKTLEQTFLYDLKEKLGDLAPHSVEYLISRTSMANGFIDDGKNKKLRAFDTIVDNPDNFRRIMVPHER